LPGDVQKVFVIEHVRPEYLARLLSVFPAEIVAVEPRTGTGGVGARVLSVSAKPAVLAAIEETIKRLDQPATEEERPSRNVEITGYVLEGLAESAPAESLPVDLQGVVGRLHRTFAYPGYRLLDTVVARARGDGSGCEVSGVTTMKLSSLAPSFYSLRASTTIDPASGMIRLSHLEFRIEMPVPINETPAGRSFQYKSIGLSSNVDIREGQFAVVGKSGLGNSENALVLVLTARVVD